MLTKSPWCLFVLAFALTIAGIQSLGWWCRPAAAQSQITTSSADPHSTPAAVQHLYSQPKHWRSAILR